MGVVLGIMRILCILFNNLLLPHSQPPSSVETSICMEISCESGIKKFLGIHQTKPLMPVTSNREKE